MVRLKPDMNSVARIRGWVIYQNPQFQTLRDKTIIQGLRNFFMFSVWSALCR
jgi:hypothetical protein